MHTVTTRCSLFVMGVSVVIKEDVFGNTERLRLTGTIRRGK